MRRSLPTRLSNCCHARMHHASPRGILLRQGVQLRTLSALSSSRLMLRKPTHASLTHQNQTHTHLRPFSSSSGSSKTGTHSHLVDLYKSMAEHEKVQHDEHQIRALQALDRLRGELLEAQQDHGGIVPPPVVSLQEDEDERKEEGFWSSMMAKVWPTTADTESPTLFDANNTTSTSMIEGVYLHGGVGCGKTFCMDLFYDSLTHARHKPPSDSPQQEPQQPPTWVSEPVFTTKQKVHFHQFMLQHVHRRMHLLKQSHPHLTANQVMAQIASNILKHGQVLCFDEFQVLDVADALILRRLFQALWNRGAIVVITSNRPPQDLYLGGLQRELFLPFIDVLHQRMQVVGMWESEVDYRLLGKQPIGEGEDESGGVYFVGLEGEGRKKYEHVWKRLIKGEEIASMTIEVNAGDDAPSDDQDKKEKEKEKEKEEEHHNIPSSKRTIFIPIALPTLSIARFTFDQLCLQPRGAADYLTLASTFHTLFLDDVPKLSENQINIVRRFIVLIDALYEAKVKVIINAEGKPEELYQVDLEDRVSGVDERFAFDRTRSRLEEMRSEGYLKQRWIGGRKKKKKKEEDKSRGGG